MTELIIAIGLNIILVLIFCLAYIFSWLRSYAARNYVVPMLDDVEKRIVENQLKIACMSNLLAKFHPSMDEELRILANIIKQEQD